uniref:DZF domain-containing protein n=1 Tax=Ditylenchus dipsaci TaxID=166011 RepID=A0A915DFX4_9BILA
MGYGVVDREDSFFHPSRSRPGDAIRRVFEVIAGGTILNKGSGLFDPCEKESKDVLGNLSEQEREDITSSAQHALRLISFNQIYKILAIERLPDKKPGYNGPNSERKRAHVTVEVKKRKKKNRL